MATFTRDGYGQVELNQMSAQKTGQIFASLPLDEKVNTLQNGEFMYYDYSTGKVTAEPGVKGQEPMLVYNEIKLYDGWRDKVKDFAMFRSGENYVTVGKKTEGYGDGAPATAGTVNPHTEYPYRMAGIAPRVFKTNVGDIFTTNMVATGVEYAEKEILSPSVVTAADGGKTLVLKKGGEVDIIKFVVAKVYTMPDGQPGLKLQRIV